MGVEISLKEKSISKMLSCPARGMGVEIKDYGITPEMSKSHAPQGHGSRNGLAARPRGVKSVMPCEGHGVETINVK